VTAWVQGGLGNQLFVLNAAVNAAAAGDCEYHLSRSSFLRDKLRRPALTGVVPRARFLPLRQEVALGFPYDRAGRLRSRTMGPGLEIVTTLSDARPGSLLVGFFQDRRSLEAGTGPVVEILKEHRQRLPAALTRRVAGRPAVHVRRGDYVTSPAARATFGSLTEAYYRDAMDRLGIPRDEWVFFSDEPDRVMEEFGVPRSSVLGPGDTGSDLEALLLMSAASHLIIPNSSFSWWAATAMGRPDAVVAPARWFLDKPEEASPRDERWISVDGP
jgi:hypothetical protein